MSRMEKAYVLICRIQKSDGVDIFWQRNPRSRTSVTVEDLNTKSGTLVNGTQIKGTKYVVTADSNEIKMAHCSKLFRYVFNFV